MTNTSEPLYFLPWTNASLSSARTIFNYLHHHIVMKYKNKFIILFPKKHMQGADGIIDFYFMWLW